jgi:hypothetical protein
MPRLTRALSGFAVLLVVLFSTSPRAEETHGEDGRYRWTHSEDTTSDFSLDDGTEVRVHTVTTIVDKRWLKQPQMVGGPDAGPPPPPKETLIFDQRRTVTHTEGWDGSVTDKRSTVLNRRDEYNLDLPEDTYITQSDVKTVPTGPNTKSSDQSSFSYSATYSPNPDDPKNPTSWGSRAEQTVHLKYIGDVGRPVGDEFVQWSRDGKNVPGIAGGSPHYAYARRTTWTDDSRVARLAASFEDPLNPPLIYEYLPAEGWRENGVLVPPNRLDAIRQKIRYREMYGIRIFMYGYGSYMGVPQEFVSDFIDLALGFWPMA